MTVMHIVENPYSRQQLRIRWTSPWSVVITRSGRDALNSEQVDVSGSYNVLCPQASWTGKEQCDLFEYLFFAQAHHSFSQRAVFFWPRSLSVQRIVAAYICCSIEIHFSLTHQRISCPDTLAGGGYYLTKPIIPNRTFGWNSLALRNNFVYWKWRQLTIWPFHCLRGCGVWKTLVRLQRGSSDMHTFTSN